MRSTLDSYLNSCVQVADRGCPAIWTTRLRLAPIQAASRSAAARKPGCPRRHAPGREFAGRQRALALHLDVDAALADLYRETGTAAYLELARQFTEQRVRGLAGDSGLGRRYLQDHLPVRASSTEVGHVVRALYLEALVTVQVRLLPPEHHASGRITGALPRHGIWRHAVRPPVHGSRLAGLAST